MEENKIVKKVIRKPVETSNKSGSNSDAFFKILNVIMFVMVFVIFVRGFNIKGTVREESVNTQIKVEQMLTEMKAKIDNDRQIDKNEILSAFALYSRLDLTSLKEREEYHKQQQAKYESMAKQYNQGLNNLVKEIKSPKDSIK